jgi:uncharacterized protein (DUF58 family)
MRRRYHLRLPFWIYCGLTLLVAIAAMNDQSSLLFWVFGVMASSLLVSGAVSGLMMTALRVRRVLPAHGTVGEPLSIHYAVRNRNRLVPAFNLHVVERAEAGASAWRRLMAPARAWLMHVGPGETVHGEAIYRPDRRGTARLDELQLGTSFPFGIVGKSITISQPQRLRVYPRLYQLRRRVLEAIAPAGLVGTRITHHAGAGDDYFGLREFRDGDSMRSIAWKRTANRDQLVSVERASPSPPKLRVVLNLVTPTTELVGDAVDAARARALEEDAISLVASVVHAADFGAYEIGLTLLGVDHEPIPVRRSHWHRNRIMAALAEIDLDAPRTPPGDIGASGREHVGLVVIHPVQPEVGLVPGEAWHFSARQMEHLVLPDAPLGAPAPRPVEAADDGAARASAASGAVA